MDSTRKSALGTKNEIKRFNTINRFIKELGFWLEWKRYLAHSGVEDWWKKPPMWVFYTGNFHDWVKLPNGLYFSDLFKIFLYFFDKGLLKWSAGDTQSYRNLIRRIEHHINYKKVISPTDSLSRAIIYLDKKGYVDIWMWKTESELQKVEK